MKPDLTRRTSMLLLAAAGLAGGVFGVTTSSSASTSRAGAAKPGLLVVSDATVADSLDPDGPSSSVNANLTAINNTYDNLVTYEPAPNPSSLGGGETIDAHTVAPDLATSWKVTNSSVTFTLRQGVKDQYGNELTAQDALWSYQRSIAAKATGAFVYSTDARVTGAKVLGKYVIQYETKGPAPMLLFSMAQPYLKIIDEVEVKKYASAKDPYGATWLTNHTAGFGAYDVASFQSGKSLDLTPSLTYWGTKAQNKIDLIPIPNSSNRFSALQKGTINVAFGLTPQQEASALTDSSLHVYRINGNALVALYNNFDVAAMKSPLVRQALQYATPQDQIVKDVYDGFGFDLKSLATPYSTGYTSKYWHYGYNIAQAKALMKQAGYPNGFSTTLYYASDSPTLATLATILQSSYAQIGIKLTLSAEPSSVLVTKAFGSKNLPMWMTDQGSSVIPDIANVGAIWVTGGFANVTGYSDKAFDAAANSALSTNDQATRLADFNTLQKVAAADPPTTLLAGLQGVAVTSANVKGYAWQPDQSQVFKSLTVSGS